MALGLLLLAACPQAADPGPDGGPGPDQLGSADSGADAGRADGGPPDAGPPDAGAPDAGALDAGAPDAGEPDAGPADAGCGCGGAHCMADGGCGQCMGDHHCGGATPVCDLATSTCVGCLAAPTDTCPTGSYCAAGTCLPGCRDGAACTSGICLGTHDCATCQGDQQCAGGRACGTGACLATCTTAAGCPSGWDCCGGRCVDPARDPLHCGQCTTTCAAPEFCGQGQCQAPALLNVCRQPLAWVLYDGEPTDDAWGPQLATALSSACGASASVQGCGQTDGGVLDPVTGEPLQLGTVLVTAGGSYRQRAVAWLEATGRAPVVGPNSAVTYQYTRPDGGVIAEADPATITPWHDVFVVQLVRTPSGALVLNAAGIFAPGTAAAAWYFIHTMLPQRLSLTQAWYVVDWSDTDRDLQPSAGDTWIVLDSGT